MLKELPVAELVQRINLNEVTHVSITCALCQAAVTLPLQKCKRGTLDCPGCGRSLMTPGPSNPLGGLAVALEGMHEASEVQGAPIYEFILKAPASAG